MNLKDYQHIFKLDPAKEISDDELMQICESGTDAVIIGGSDDVTEDNVLNLMSRVRRYAVDCIQEPNDIEVATLGFDGYIFPYMIQSKEVQFHTGYLFEGIRSYGHMIDYSSIQWVPYIVTNDKAKVFHAAKCHTVVQDDDLLSYIDILDKVMKSPYIYIEHSGDLIDIERLKMIKEQVTHSHIIYGGGITNERIAKEVMQYVDTIIVGNGVYEDIKSALKTVKVIKSK